MFPDQWILLAGLVCVCSFAAAQVVSPVQSTTLLTRGARIDFSAVKGQLVLDIADLNDTYYDVWTMQPTGSGRVCLTCGKPGLDQLHNGAPSWHPSGNYIVFQSQDASLPFVPEELAPLEYRFTNPGYGTNNNVWIMDATATNFWQLTQIAAGYGVLHPTFNRAGTQLMWAEKVGLILPDQQWTIKLADFSIVNNTPVLSNLREIHPLGTNTFYETHDFSPSGDRILFSAGSPSQASLDIYRYDLNTGVLLNLTNSPGEWDEHAHYTPDGTRIVWASSRSITKVHNFFSPFLDYWVMLPNGAARQRLTYYNDEGAPEHYANGLATADFSFGGPQQLFGKLELTNAVPDAKRTFVIAYIQFAAP